MEALENLQQLHAEPNFDRFPILSELISNLGGLKFKLSVQRCKAGADIHFENEVDGIKNRAHLRIFFPTETKCVLFFHKKSSIPFSRDRFSYGGVVIDSRSTERFTSRDVGEWIQFLISGLKPHVRPASLRKSVPFTIPEDEFIPSEVKHESSI